MKNYILNNYIKTHSEFNLKTKSEIYAGYTVSWISIIFAIFLEILMIIFFYFIYNSKIFSSLLFIFLMLSFINYVIFSFGLAYLSHMNNITKNK